MTITNNTASPTRNNTQQRPVDGRDEGTRDQPMNRAAPVDSDTAPYSVRKGDTLTEIARRHDTTVDELTRLNPELRANPNALRTGQNIDVPIADEAAAPPRRQVSTDTQQAARERFAAGEDQIKQRIGVDAYTRPAPSLDDVRSQGDSMRRGMKGESVRDVQRMLNNAGANPPLAEDGKFGPKTEAALRAYQEGKGIQQTGVLGSTTLSRLEREPPVERHQDTQTSGRTQRNNNVTSLDGVQTGPLAQRIGDAAEREARRMGTVGRCALGVNNALTSQGIAGRGHAYQKAEQLARDSRFREVNISRDQLDNLPRGAVIVWGRSGAKPYGHIAVALGNGTEASDHIQRQMMGGRYGTDFGRGPDPQGRQFRVFIPQG
jgi:peptidoglycan hydrolase-like protein with peptidoglycan-binding domain